MPTLDSRLVRLLTVVAATLVAALGLGSVAHAATPGLDVTPPTQTRIAAALATKTKLVRFFVEWRTLQPEKGGKYPATDPGAKNEARVFDDAITQVIAGGAQPAFNVVGAPKWANGSEDDQYIPPTNPQDFADFMALFVSHTKDVATKAGGDIAFYNVWNEQDEKIFWHDANPADATKYAALLKATYAAAKPAAGGTPITVGATTGNNADYIAQLYAKGAKGSFDGVAVDTDTACLTNGPDVYVRDSAQGDRINQFSFLGYRTVRDVMVANGDADKGIYLELGWSSTGGVPGACDPSRVANAGNRSDGVTLANQAAFLTQGYGCVAQDSYVKAAYWFTMFDNPGEALNENRNYGLLTDGFGHKPSYDAFTAVVAGGGNATAPCGDFVPPAITILTPTPDFGFTGRLLIRASATDQAGPGVNPVGLLRLTFKVDDQPQAIGNFGPSNNIRDGDVAQQDYFGASKLPDGPHKITVQARDMNGNVSSSSVNVCKGAACVKTSYTTKLVLDTGKQPKCAGLSCSVSGRLTGPAGVALSGRVRVQWQLFVKMRVKSRIPGRKAFASKWVTFHKGASPAGKPFAFKQKLKKKGKWRVRVSYDGAAPLKRTSLPYKTFRP